MFCKKCGSKLQENAVFCEQCGYKNDHSTDANVINNRKPCCAKCGAVLKDNSSFCEKCGTKIEFRNIADIKSPESETNYKRRYTVIVIIGIVLILVAVLSIVLLLVFGTNSSKKNSTDNGTVLTLITDSAESSETEGYSVTTIEATTTEVEVESQTSISITTDAHSDEGTSVSMVNEKYSDNSNESDKLDNPKENKAKVTVDSKAPKYPSKTDDITLDQSFLNVDDKSYVNIKSMSIEDSYGEKYYLEGDRVICISGKYQQSEYVFSYLLSNGYYRGFVIHDMPDINGSYTFTVSYDFTDSVSKITEHRDNYTFTIS